VAAALSGVLAYLGLGLLGFIGAPRTFSLLALLGGTISFALWTPGFPEVLVGGLPWGVALAGDLWAVGLWALALVLHATLLIHARARRDAFHPLTTVLIGTCLAGSLSRDLFNLYVLMDLSSLLALVLIASGRRVRAVWAGLQYLVLTEVGLTLYLFGLGLVYARMGTLSVSALALQGPNLSDPALAVGVGLLLAGAAVKTVRPWALPRSMTAFTSWISSSYWGIKSGVVQRFRQVRQGLSWCVHSTLVGFKQYPKGVLTASRLWRPSQGQARRASVTVQSSGLGSGSPLRLHAS